MAPKKRRPGRGDRESGPPRKDRIVQTRVPEDLESTLKDAAREQRVTVSHLIRNVLEDTFNLVDNIVAESAHLADTVRRDAKRLASSAQGHARAAGVPAAAAAPKEFLDEVYGWQELKLNKDVSCTRCGAAMKRGEQGFRGLMDNPPPGTPIVWMCASCSENL